MAADPPANGILKTSNAESFAGFSRFEIELEFVQSLANPKYLQYLAVQKYFEDADFVRYLKYLLYWREPQYLRYLQWPGPTLRALELVQDERFRSDILRDEVCYALVEEVSAAALAGPYGQRDQTAAAST